MMGPCRPAEKDDMHMLRREVLQDNVVQLDLAAPLIGFGVWNGQEVFG